MIINRDCGNGYMLSYLDFLKVLITFIPVTLEIKLYVRRDFIPRHNLPVTDLSILLKTMHSIKYTCLRSCRKALIIHVLCLISYAS